MADCVALPKYIAAMFANDVAPETDHAIIEERYGTRVAVYATINSKLFHMQRKYRALFAGPFAQRIECFGVMAPLLVNGCPIEPAAQCTMNPTRYFADIFSADSSAIKVIQTVPNPDDNSVAEPIMRAFRSLHVECVIPPKVGSRAIVSRDEFMVRLDKTLRKHNGAPDAELRAIINDAGAKDVRENNYCVAGGFISKLIDPATTPRDFDGSDVDIFVYGDAQSATIDRIVARLFTPNRTFVVVHGCVISIYRTDAIKVQVVSSACSVPCGVIAGFDLPHVMTFWSNGTVFANANCLRAFQRRTSTIMRLTEHKNETRLIKLLRAGFHIALGKDEGHRAKLFDLVRDADKLWISALNYVAFVRIDDRMAPSEQIARIMQHDNVVDVITNIDTSMLSTCGPTCAPDKLNSTLAAQAPHVKAAEDQGAPILASQMLLLRKMIGGYSSLSICDADWGLVDVSRFPSTIGAIESIRIAGFRAFISVDIIGTIVASASRTSSRLIYILEPKCGDILMRVVATIDAKQRAAGRPPLATDIVACDGVVKIAVDASTRAADPVPKSSRPSGLSSISIALRVRCIAANEHRLCLFVRD